MYVNFPTTLSYAHTHTHTCAQPHLLKLIHSHLHM